MGNWSDTLRWGYVGLFGVLFLFALWAGSTGAVLSDPVEKPKSLRKENPRPDHRQSRHRRNRYFWPSGGVRGGK